MNEEAYVDNTKIEESPKRNRKNLRGLILNIAIIVLVLLVVRFLIQGVVVSGSSMQNTLRSGDNLVLEKLSYKISKPKRFDIVVVPKEEGSKYYLIKRVIGLPGETVLIKKGATYINGKLLSDTHGNAEMNDPGIAGNPVKLGKDEYFVLGDNRNNSVDSRIVGPVKGKDIVGHIVFRLYPSPRVF